MMNYTQVLEQTEQLKIGKKLPDTMKLCEKIDCNKIIYIPESYECDAIGELIEAILKEHKYNEGRFTTYALKNPLGQILYNKKPISQKDFAKYGEKLLTPNDTLFTKEEFLLKLALDYFKDENADFLVLPCDTGCEAEFFVEKLDSCAVSEKEKVCKELATTLILQKNIVLQEKTVERACQKCKYEGRFEILKKKPFYIADGADDEKSTKLLMAKLQYHYPNNPYIFIVGMAKDSYETVVKECALAAQQIITITPPEAPNAIPGIELAQEFSKLNQNITNASSIEEAVEIASILADKDTVIVAFGTTVFLERYRQLLLKTNK